jgi:glucose/arabinose dehydrogenase/mono/diheme cytochrome c family protein
MRLLNQFFILVGLFCLACNSQNPTEQFILNRYLADIQVDNNVLVLSTVAENLQVPWEITWGPDNWLWFTQQKGTVTRLNPETGEQKQILKIKEVHYQKSRGLLGMAIHPDFAQHPYVYLHYTFLDTTRLPDKVIYSKLVRYTYQNQQLISPKILLDSIPGKTYHNGSRVLITPDKKLLLSTGDAGNPQDAQDLAKITGKILRMNLDGSIPVDNPNPKSLIWAAGFRNPQGLIVGVDGQIYCSDHGPNNDDEVNLIQKGKNYGWPEIHGFCDTPEEKKFCAKMPVITPLKAWTPTIAVAGLDYYNNSQIPAWQNSLILANLKGRALRVLKLDKNGQKIQSEHIYLQKQLGRIRDVCVAPNGDIYLTTSNLDWHLRDQYFMYAKDSLPKPKDDRIVRIRVADKSLLAKIQQLKTRITLQEDKMAAEMPTEDYQVKASQDQLSLGESIYKKNCVACHQKDGSGSEAVPTLVKTDWVTGDKTRLIYLVFNGLSDKIKVNNKEYEGEMPGFGVILKDEEIAAVLNYIRTNFGNQAPLVSVAEVSEERRSKNQ